MIQVHCLTDGEMMKLLYVFLLGMSICFANPTWANTKHKPVNKHHKITHPSHHRNASKTTHLASNVNFSHKNIRKTPIYGDNQLADEINYIINTSKASNDAAIAVYVKSMSQGDTLYTRNIYHPFIPASTLKVLTAEASLLFLGPEYRFSTQLLTDAKSIKDGVLQGNLYILLSGDPSLTYDDLEDLLLSLKKQQIQTISGNVYIDFTAYDQDFYGPGWDWKDRKYCYGAPISGSIINHNCLSLAISPTSAGQSAHIVRSDKYFYPAIRNSVVTKSKSMRACSLRLSTGSRGSIDLDGCMPSGRYVWGLSYVIADIPEYNRALFSDLLRHLSIRVQGNVLLASAPRHLSFISSHDSKPLKLLLSDMMKKSDNVIAEALFKKISQLYNRRPGSWQGGTYAVTQILSTRIGVDTRGMRILDGSGLSAANLATPSQMMQVLNYAFHHSTNDVFISALPIAGVDGTLKHRMGNIARKVHAKTGTISGVISLAGYALAANQEPLAFVIMINGSKGLAWRYREMEDKIATALTRYER